MNGAGGYSGKGGGAGVSGGGQTVSPSQQNRAQRYAILNSSVEMTQQVYSSTTAAPGANTTLNIQPRNVGLVKRFIIVVSGTANNTGADTANLTDIGLSNLFSQIVFTDLQNNVRVQTAGWHLNFVWGTKHKMPLAQAILNSATQDQSGAGGFGDEFDVIVPPTGIGTGTSQAFQAIFELPLAYSDDDLRGAIYMNVVNAVAQLQLTFNPAPFTAAGVDSTLAVWKGSAGNISNVTVTVYQVYLDQLPVNQKTGQPILPMLDLSTVYEIKNTVFSAIVQSQDFPMPYANFRDFISTSVVYNHDPSADAGRVGGGDVNYFALQSANFTNLWKYPPVIAALKVRQLLRQDMPLGCYYFSSRRKPISTTTYGNMELILNASAAAAGAYALVGWEDFALINALTNAGSLAAQ